MPRIYRILPVSGVFHILTRGNNRENIFHKNKDFETYLKLLKKYKIQHNILVYHYCIMTNHVHLIIEKNQDSDLAKFMKQLNLSYAHYYCEKYKYCGHLWQGRFKSLIIDNDEYLLMCGKYIEMNPVRAKMTRNPSKYLWSSYSVYAYGKDSSIVDIDPLYSEFGKDETTRQESYRKRSYDEKDIDLNGRYLGSEKFISKMEKKYGIKNLRRTRGRPKKGE